MRWKTFYKNYKAKYPLFFAGAITTIQLYMVGCTSFDYLTQVEPHFPTAHDCGKCHVDIHEEWSQSDHSWAYTNPHFQSATCDYSFTDCLSCHAPDPAVSESRPTLRTVNTQEGITCVTCHLRDGAIEGPLEPTGKIKPHPIRVNPDFYNDSLLCGRCHEGSYQEWIKQPESNQQSCQSCHMPSINRKVTQATGGISNWIVALEKEVEQKSHLISIVNHDAMKDWIDVNAVRQEQALVISVKNNLPHSLPTGDYGFRVLEMKWFALGRNEQQILLGKQELARENHTGIGPGDTQNWIVEVPMDATRLHLELLRRSYEDQDIITVADIEVPIK